MSRFARIGVISDTHVPARAKRIPEAVLKAFEDVQLILHAGDLSTLSVIEQLEAYAPVEAVQGNVETPEVVATVPLKRELVVADCTIGMLHILGDGSRYEHNARREFPGARVVVFGHSHVPYLHDTGDLLLLNPGSATDRRRQPHCTFAILTITDSQPAAEIMTLL